LANEPPTTIEQEAAWTTETVCGFGEEIKLLPIAGIDVRFLGCPLVVKTEAKPATENVTRKCHVKEISSSNYVQISV
jgi:hypothetical protein